MIPINTLKQAYAISFNTTNDIIDVFYKIYGKQYMIDNAYNMAGFDTIKTKIRIIERTKKIKNLIKK